MANRFTTKWLSNVTQTENLLNEGAETIRHLSAWETEFISIFF